MGRLQQVREMQAAGVQFFPGLQHFDDRVVDRLYDLWKHRGSPLSINIYHGGYDLNVRVRAKRRAVRRSE